MTGDESYVEIWAVVMVVSLAGAVGLFIVMKRKKKDE
jgi:LPXTG-motif cell wall-anchored protein